jgi:hypothetical protein
MEELDGTTFLKEFITLKVICRFLGRRDGGLAAMAGFTAVAGI